MNRAAYTVGAVATFVLVAGLLLGLAAGVGAVSGLLAPMDDTSAPSYDVDELYIEPLEAEGAVTATPGAAGEPGVVVVDAAHANALDAAQIESLTSAMVAYGHEVRSVGNATDLEEELTSADALVVVDPGSPYRSDEAAAVQEFVEDGGRIVLLGEPSRMALDGGVLTPVDAEINSIANRLGVSFGTDYVYDMQANDGNHRNVVVEPTNDPMMTGIDAAVVSVGTHVTAGDGEPLLVTAPTAQRSAGETTGQYTVAVRTESVLAIGDSTFLAPDRFNVADNEAVIAAIVEFLGGEYD